VVCCLLGRHGMKLFLTGERFSGTQAVTMGLAHRAVPADQLLAAVQEEIDAIQAGGPIAVAECKKLVRRIPTLSEAEAFTVAGQWSRRMFMTPGRRGHGAFREKRKPSWVESK
jgi:methylglutaconyl-CoA hydratase